MNSKCATGPLIVLVILCAGIPTGYSKENNEKKKTSGPPNPIVKSESSPADDICRFAAAGRIQKVSQLLADNPQLVNARSSWGGETPLHEAAWYNRKDVVQFLLAKGADINVVDEHGETPLHRAARSGNKDIVEILLARGADVNAKEKGGYTPLHGAALKGYMEIAKVLLAGGAQVSEKNNEGLTPPQVAESQGHKEFAEFLRNIAQDAESERSSEDINVSTEENLRRKLAANPLSPWELGQEMARKMASRRNIFQAASFGDIEEVNEFIHADTNIVNARDFSGLTPLHHAAFEGHVEIVKFLIEANADLNAKDEHGITALYLAAEEGHLKVVELLVENGADINAPLTYQIGEKTQRIAPLQVAESNGKHEVAEFLKKHAPTKK